MRVHIPRLGITDHSPELKGRVALVAGVALGALAELDPELPNGPEACRPGTVKIVAAWVHALEAVGATHDEIGQIILLLGAGWTIDEGEAPAGGAS